jgi:hypothetical protein
MHSPEDGTRLLASAPSSQDSVFAALCVPFHCRSICLSVSPPLDTEGCSGPSSERSGSMCLHSRACSMSDLVSRRKNGALCLYKRPHGAFGRVIETSLTVKLSPPLRLFAPPEKMAGGPFWHSRAPSTLRRCTCAEPYLPQHHPKCLPRKTPHICGLPNLIRD